MSTGIRIEDVTTLTENFLVEHLGERGKNVTKNHFTNYDDGGGFTHVVATINGRRVEVEMPGDCDLDEVLEWMV
jgi:hypothetical protein